MIKIIRKIIELNSLQLFEKCVEILGDLFISCQDLNNAVNMYTIQRNFGDITSNYEFKLRALGNLGLVCKLRRKFEQALLFFKKALEYSWLLKNQEAESIQYERFGLIYFLLGDFDRAKYYHQRSVNFSLEVLNSKSQKIDINQQPSLKFAYKVFTCQARYDRELQSRRFHKLKIFIIYLDARQGSDLNLNQSENEIQLKYRTTLSVDYQIETILQEKEFQYSIPSPRQSKECRIENGYIRKDCEQNFDESIQRLHNRISQETIKQIPKVRNNAEHVKINRDILKIPLNLSIKHRLTEDYTKVRLIKDLVVSSSINLKIFNQNTEHILLFNHLTPNRNMEGFNYHQRHLSVKITRFFDELIKELKN